MTQKWQRREISNFEYLMFLNTIAGKYLYFVDKCKTRSKSTGGRPIPLGYRLEKEARK